MSQVLREATVMQAWGQTGLSWAPELEELSILIFADTVFWIGDCCATVQSSAGQLLHASR